MRRSTLLGLIFFIGVFITERCVSHPRILWQKCVGGSQFDQANSMVQTTDSGFIIAGITTSNDDDVSGYHGRDDAWVTKLDKNGALQWQKCYGGTGDELFRSIVETTDGGFVMAGETSSNDGDVSGIHAGSTYDAWIVKVNANGAIQWQKCLGGSGTDEMSSIIQVSDGGFIAVGETDSHDGDVTGNHGAYDVWIVKLDNSGVIQWQECLGGTSDDVAGSVIETTDGGCLIGGWTNSNDGNVAGNHGGWDSWIIKLNAAGTLQWQKCLGGTKDDLASSVVQAANGDFVIACGTNSNDGDVSGNHGNGDLWVADLNNSGGLQWQRCYGGTKGDVPTSIIQTADHGFAIAGFTQSNDWNVFGNHGGNGVGDAWVLKLGTHGELEWQKCLGGTQDDEALAVVQNSDSAYTIGGWTNSNDGDVSNNHGKYDAWIVQFSPPPPPPTIAYITPDAGAPGMCVAVEIIAPANMQGTFGDDQMYVSDSAVADTLVELTRPSDTALVRLGPSIVSWNGRMIQQMFLIEPLAKQIDTEVYFRVIWNGQSSATDSFRILTPKHLGVMSGGAMLPANLRTSRNTMVVDSMILNNGLYTLPQSDPDNNTNGNQGFLPLRILSMGPIVFNHAGLHADGSPGLTGTGGGAGGAGGGGGGSGYPGKGGDGYTGGGGDNDGTNGPGGEGTGSFTGSNNWDGGSSLNGVSGGAGEQHSGLSGDDGGGGGTGHPFGSSGQHGNASSSPAGGYGGGSAGGSTSNYTTNYGGGGGGYSTAGMAGAGTGSNAGNIVGNPMLIPLAGGSGGGAGNQTYVSLFGGQGGCGGGGGGAIELTSFSHVTLSISGVSANGGSGSSGIYTVEPAAGGGGGSGGAVAISARDSVAFDPNSSISVTHGNDGGGSNRGGLGGEGRIRINGFVSSSQSSNSRLYFVDSIGYTGPSIQRISFTPDSAKVHGYAEYWDSVPANPLDIEVYYAWPSAPSWQSVHATPRVDPRSHTAQWDAEFPISANPRDTELYAVAVQNESVQTGTFADVPYAVLSHTSGMIAKVTGPPKMVVRTTTINFGNILIDSCSSDTTLFIYSTGKSDLIIDSAHFTPPIPDFKIKTTFPQTVHTGDWLKVTLSFCPTAVKCPIASTLDLFSNGGDTAIALTGCGVQPEMDIHPDTLDFGRVHVGDCKDSFVVVSNPGKDTLKISAELIQTTFPSTLGYFSGLDPLPLFVPPGDSVHLNLRFCAMDTNTRTALDSIYGNAPQSPFGLVLMGEGKIGVLSVPFVLDFGAVHLDSCKDSGFYAVNTGNDSLIVTSASIPIVTNFTILSPATPFVLMPNDSMFIAVRFCSSDTGRFSAVSTLGTDVPTSDSTILLAHTGIGILQMLNLIDFGNVPTGGCADTNIVLKNIGADTLVLEPTSDVTPPFSYKGPAKVTLAPGEAITVPLYFCPQDTNEAIETTLFDTVGAGQNVLFTLRGKGIEGALATSGALDVGCIPVGTDTTIRVTIHNTGTAALDSLMALIVPSSVATIVHAPPTSLAAGAADSIVIVIPASTVGAISGTLAIAWRGSTGITLPITGNVSPKPGITALDTSIVFDTTNIGDSSVTQCLRVTNYSCIPIGVSSLSITGALPGEFEIVSDNVGGSLVDSAVGTICIRYRPLRSGVATGELSIVSNTDTLPVASLSGFGKGNPLGVELKLDTVSGRPGEIVTLPVRTVNDVTSAAITSLTFRVTFNPMQLDMKALASPVVLGIIPASASGTSATYSVKTYSIGDKEVTVKFASPLVGAPVVAQLPFEILEPTASTAAIHLKSATFGASAASLMTAFDGEIAIEQCDTNDRVSLGMNPVDVSQNNPNPFHSETDVALTVNVAGHVTIDLYNALGTKIATPFDEDLPIGSKNVPVDARTLPGGVYRYIVTWTGPQPELRVSKTMVVLGE